MVNEVELKNLIQKNASSHIYFLFGDDPYLVKTYTDKIVNFVVGDNADLDLTSLDYNAKVSEISEATMQFSFFGGRKCVTVSNYDFESLSASEYKEFKKMLLHLTVWCYILILLLLTLNAQNVLKKLTVLLLI